MKRHAIIALTRLNRLAARRGIACGVLVLMNGVHALIHGTVLDGGSLDAAVFYVNAWVATSAMDS